MITNLSHWINGIAIKTSEETITVTSPYDNTIIATVPLGSIQTVHDAVTSSHAVSTEWANKTIRERVAILSKFHSLLISHSQELASLIVLEHGKTRQEALAEIAKGNETLEWALGMGTIAIGKIAQVSRGVTCQDEKRPLGVVVQIVPFNFPFMVPMWTLPIALATGNTVIIKPSEKVPLTMNATIRLLKEAGLPDGVVNLVHGKAETVLALCDHPLVRAVSFVGTSHVAKLVSDRCRLLNKRVIALGGAKNHLVAAPDCDINMASSDIVASFTGCAGQRCMAASVLLVIGNQKDLIQQVVSKAALLKPGSGQGQMGPVIDQASQSKIIKYISDSEEGGAKILLDGRSWVSQSLSDPAVPGLHESSNGALEEFNKSGHWIGPTIILHTNPKDKALHDEIFGPVLSILQVSTKEEAIAIENDNPYGNAACIYTQNGGVAEWFTKRFQAGMLGVNIGVPVPREPFSFGGIGASKFGDCDITGEGAVEFFTERRKVTCICKVICIFYEKVGYFDLVGIRPSVLSLK